MGSTTHHSTQDIVRGAHINRRTSGRIRSSNGIAALPQVNQTCHPTLYTPDPGTSRSIRLARKFSSINFSASQARTQHRVRHRNVLSSVSANSGPFAVHLASPVSTTRHQHILRPGSVAIQPFNRTLHVSPLSAQTPRAVDMRSIPSAGGGADNASYVSNMSHDGEPLLGGLYDNYYDFVDVLKMYKNGLNLTDSRWMDQYLPTSAGYQPTEAFTKSLQDVFLDQLV